MSERLRHDAIARLVEDLGAADLGDPRRVMRAQAIMARLAAAPDATLPDAMVTDAELEGAYRLFSNENVSFEALFDAHSTATAERACGAGLVLAIHDTTACCFRYADPREVGYLNTGKAGFPLHLSLLVDTREWRRPFGLTYAEVLPRSKRPRAAGTKHRLSSHASAKKSDSEFLRWQRGIEATERQLAGSGASIIHVADRESDSYALMAGCLAQKQRFIFRSRGDRNALLDGNKIPVRVLVEDCKVAFVRSVPLSRRIRTSTAPNQAYAPRESRHARLCFAATKAALNRPHIAGAHLPKSIEVNVLHVFEKNPPKGQEPVDWLLFTTEQLATQRQIEDVVDYYRCRWMAEELNKALKTGCVVQERRLESFDAITTMLALSLPIAVELLALRALAQADSSAPATTLLTTSQLAALGHISHRPLPTKPTVQDVLWCVAGLGGHIKNNGPPGWQVLQRGMEKFVSFAAGWCAREEADL